MNFISLLIVLTLFSFKAFSSESEKYIKSIDNLKSACLNKDSKTQFCESARNVQDTVENFGREIADTLTKKIDMPLVTMASGFALKTLIEKKVVIDPKIDMLWNPKLEIEQDKAFISFHTEFPF